MVSPLTLCLTLLTSTCLVLLVVWLPIGLLSAFVAYWLTRSVKDSSLLLLLPVLLISMVISGREASETDNIPDPAEAG